MKKSCFHSSSNGRRVFGEDLLRLGKQRQMHAGFAAFDLGQILPDLVGGEAEDGRDQPRPALR
jgi:hypothetical protein